MFNVDSSSALKYYFILMGQAGVAAALVGILHNLQSVGFYQYAFNYSGNYTLFISLYVFVGSSLTFGFTHATVLFT